MNIEEWSDANASGTWATKSPVFGFKASLRPRDVMAVYHRLGTLATTLDEVVMAVVSHPDVVVTGQSLGPGVAHDMARGLAKKALAILVKDGVIQAPTKVLAWMKP